MLRLQIAVEADSPKHLAQVGQVALAEVLAGVREKELYHKRGRAWLRVEAVSVPEPAAPVMTAPGLEEEVAEEVAEEVEVPTVPPVEVPTVPPAPPEPPEPTVPPEMPPVEPPADPPIPVLVPMVPSPMPVGPPPGIRVPHAPEEDEGEDQ